MYIYFDKLKAVITCEEYPEVLSIEKMKECKMENLCNKWEKTEVNDGQFLLSYKYKKNTCDCDNSTYTTYSDYDDYDCYRCGRLKVAPFEDGTVLYLQNSGSIDIVCTKPHSRWNEICQVEGHPNVYQWIPRDDDKYGPSAFVLHARNIAESTSRYLSDNDMIKELSANENIDNCHIIFAESLKWLKWLKCKEILLGTSYKNNNDNILQKLPAEMIRNICDYI